MAIYSLNVASIGKTTHAAGTAGAHVRYIARPDACSHLDAEHFPVADLGEAPAWIDRQETLDRKNARVLDKVRVALPRELNEEQRAELVRAFCQDVTGGRVPWLAGIHQSGDDAHNPHAHIIVRDRDIDTGKRVLRWSDSPRDRAKMDLPPNAVDHIRERWEVMANAALEKAGIDARIDRRSLEAQGVDRAPTIHIGPRAQHIDGMVQRPESQVRPQRKRRLRNSGYENSDVADYPMIDAGRTRQERNAEIIDLNLERAARSPDFETRLWARHERDQVREDRQVQEWIVVRARRRTLEERRIKSEFRAKENELRQAERAERKTVIDELRRQYRPRIEDTRDRQAQERDALKRDQGRLLQRAWSFVSPAARRKRDEARRNLIGRHAGERSTLLAEYRDGRSAQLAAVKARHEPALTELRQQRRARLASAADRFGEQLKDEDGRLQARENEREASRRGLAIRLRQFRERDSGGGRDRRAPGLER
jgi:hypothetical protein